MSKQNRKVVRRLQQSDNSSLVSVDDISILEKFHGKPGTKETNKENVGKTEYNKEVNKNEQFKKPLQPATEKTLNAKLPDITSTPFQRCRVVPLANVFKEKMSPIAHVSGRFRPQTKIPVLKSKIPTFVVPQSVQNANTAVHMKNTTKEVDLLQRPATAPPLGTAASLPSQHVNKEGKAGEVKAVEKINGKQGAPHDEKKSGDKQIEQHVDKYGGGDIKPLENPVEKDRKGVDQEEPVGGMKDGELMNQRKENIHELNKTRVLVPSSGNEGTGATSIKPLLLTRLETAKNTAWSGQQNLQPVKDVTFVKECKEVRDIHKKTISSKEITESKKTVDGTQTLEGSEKGRMFKSKAEEAEIDSRCVGSDLVLDNVKVKKYQTADNVPNKTQKTKNSEIKETEEVKVSKTDRKVSKKYTSSKTENYKSKIKEAKDNEAYDTPNDKNKTNSGTKETKEIKLSDVIGEMPKANGTLLPSKTEDCTNSKAIVTQLQTKHNSTQIKETANAGYNLVDKEVFVPSKSKEIENMCDLELKIRKALCRERKTASKKQMKHQEDSKFGDISTEEELMSSLKVDLFSPTAKEKHAVSDGHKPVTSRLSKRKAKPECNASSKKGKKSVDPSAADKSVLIITENSEKPQVPQDELANKKKPTTASKRQMKQKPRSKANEERKSPNQDEICFTEPVASSELSEQTKRKARRETTLNKFVALGKTGKEDRSNPEPADIISKPEESERKRTTATRKQTRAAAKGQKGKEQKVDCTPDEVCKLEVVLDVGGTEMKEETVTSNKEINIEAPKKTNDKEQDEHNKSKEQVPDNRRRKKRKVEFLTQTKPDDPVNVADEKSVNSELNEKCKLKEENENKQELLPKDASSKKRRTKTSKKQITMDAVTECDKQEKHSEACTTEPELPKRNELSRKRKIVRVPKQTEVLAQARNQEEENLNLPSVDVCKSAAKLTEGSGEEKTILENNISSKANILKKHSHLEINGKQDKHPESGGIHRSKIDNANNENREECLNENRISKKRKIKEQEEDKEDDTKFRRSNRKRLQTVEYWRNVGNKSHIEPSTGDRNQPEMTSLSKFSVHPSEASRSFSNRSGFRKISHRWFSTGEVDFKDKDGDGSGVLYAKCISITNTVAAGYIHIESGRTFSGVATNNTMYLIQKGSVKVDIGGEIQTLKRSQFFLIIPGVPFSVENKSKTSVHLSYVKFRSVEQ